MSSKQLAQKAKPLPRSNMVQLVTMQFLRLLLWYAILPLDYFGIS